MKCGKTNLMKLLIRSVATGLVALVLLAGQALAAQPGVEVSLQEFLVPGGIEITAGDGGSTVIDFNELPDGRPTDRGLLLRAYQGVFSGNYEADGILGVTFRVKSEDGLIPATHDLRLGVTDSQGQPGEWTCTRMVFSTVPGQWVTNTICFDPDAGWDMSLGGWSEEQVRALWDECYRNVRGITFGLHQNGRQEQTYVIDDVMLFGDGYMPPHAQLTWGLLNNFGVESLEQLEPDQLTQDSNRDGTSDVVAILAGEDPGLAITISAKTGGVAVEWPCVKGMKYTVWRATSLTGDFVPVTTGIEATENGFMAHVDESVPGQGPCFYKVSKSR